MDDAIITDLEGKITEAIRYAYRNENAADKSAVIKGMVQILAGSSYANVVKLFREQASFEV